MTKLPPESRNGAQWSVGAASDCEFVVTAGHLNVKLITSHRSLLASLPGEAIALTVFGPAPDRETVSRWYSRRDDARSAIHPASPHSRGPLPVAVVPDISTTLPLPVPSERLYRLPQPRQHPLYLLGRHRTHRQPVPTRILGYAERLERHDRHAGRLE